MDKIAKVPHLREELDWLDQIYGVFDKDNDRDYLGSPTPKLVFGMTNTFTDSLLL